jgi:cytochrome c556
MKAARIIAASALLASGWALYAKPAKPSAPSPQEIVAARQAGMALSAATFGAIRNGSANAPAVKAFAFQTGGLAKWAAAMPALFAASTKEMPSRAKPEVWSDKAGFAARTADFADATKALAAAAAADDRPAFDAALARVGASCKGCHDTYQVQVPAPPKAG